MTIGQVLTAVKQMKVTMISMTVMLLTLGEKITQVVLSLHSSIQMRKKPMIGRIPQAQGEPYLGDPKLTFLDFDLRFLKNSSL